MRIKVKKIRHRWPKYFGEHDEKWARGGGRYGYARMYGASKYGSAIDYRTKAERQNALERKEIQDYEREE